MQKGKGVSFYPQSHYANQFTSIISWNPHKTSGMYKYCHSSPGLTNLGETKSWLFRHPRFHLIFPRSGVFANYYLSFSSSSSSRNSGLTGPRTHVISLPGDWVHRAPSRSLAALKDLKKLKNHCSILRSREGLRPAPEDTADVWQCQAWHSGWLSLHGPQMPQLQAALVTVTHVPMIIWVYRTSPTGGTLHNQAGTRPHRPEMEQPRFLVQVPAWSNIKTAFYKPAQLG